MDQLQDIRSELLELTDSIRDGESRGATLQRLATRVVLVIPGADAATITLLDTDAPSTIATTDDTMDVLDTAQYTAGDGPGLEASRTGILVQASLAQARQRWPAFATAATTTGIATILSCPLFLPVDDAAAHSRATEERLSGALNVWSFRPAAFDAVQTALIALFTTAVAAVILTASHWERARVQAEQLLDALDSRDIIATAKGIVMVRHQLSADDAFSWLTDLSQHTNRKLRDLATMISADPGVIGTAS